MTTSNYSQISCSTAFSCSVRTKDDESVGSIKEFMINTQTGKIDYVVLKVDQGFLNLGSKLLALPFEAFEFAVHATEYDVILVRETKMTLENAPGFDEEEWPSGPQSEFLHTVRSYYSDKNRSLHGRYDLENRTFYEERDRFDPENPGIQDQRTVGREDLDPRFRREGGDPLL